MSFNGELFSAVAPLFDEKVSFFGPIGARLAVHADIPAGATVVDLGAGKGAVTAGLRQLTQAGPITAVDVSKEMIGALRRLSLDDVTAVEADLADLPFVDEEFDHSTSGFTLHILADASRAAAEIHRVLRPGATLTWSMPGTHPDAEEWAQAYGEIYARFTALLEDPPAEMMPGSPLVKTLQDAGLDLVDHTTFPVVVPVGDSEAYWAWTQNHGARWLTDALSPEGATALREAVIDSLHRLHPDRGRSIMVAPHAFRMRRS